MAFKSNRILKLIRLLTRKKVCQLNILNYNNSKSCITLEKLFVSKYDINGPGQHSASRNSSVTEFCDSYAKVSSFI